MRLFLDDDLRVVMGIYGYAFPRRHVKHDRFAAVPISLIRRCGIKRSSRNDDAMNKAVEWNVP